jgi:hypothetical protein
LTDEHVDVAAGLVRRVVGLIEHLDQRGCGLRDLFTADGLGILAERAALIV